MVHARQLLATWSWVWTSKIRTDLDEIRVGQNSMARHEISRLDTAHLVRQLRMLVPHIVREHIRLRMKVIQLFELAPTAPPSMAKRRGNEPIRIQRVHCRSSRISDILPLRQLQAARILPHAAQPQRLDLLPALLDLVWEERLPVVGDAEDDIGALEGFLDGAHVVQVGTDNLRAQGGQISCGAAAGVPSQAADAEPVGALREEPPGYGAALVAGRTDDNDQLWACRCGHAADIRGNVTCIVEN